MSYYFIRVKQTDRKPKEGEDPQHIEEAVVIPKDEEPRQFYDEFVENYKDYNVTIPKAEAEFHLIKRTRDGKEFELAGHGCEYSTVLREGSHEFDPYTTNERFVYDEKLVFLDPNLQPK